MAQKKRDSLKVTKMDAARRQIETAISLWFEDGDAVSIHTLTAAGHQVCNAILKDRGIHASMVLNFDLMPPEFHADYKRLVLAPENFFKHAGRDADPDAEIILHLDTTEVYLVDAIYLFHKLNRKVITPKMKAFSVYFDLLHPHLLKDDAKAVFPKPLGIILRQIPRDAFLKAFLKVFNKLKRK